MWSKIALTWAAFGLVLTVGAAELVWGQVGFQGRAGVQTIEERSFLTDFRTLYECLERVTRDRDLSVKRTGGGSGRANGRQFAARLKERFAVVADREKLYFDEEPIIYIAEIGSQSDKRDRSQLRTIKLDPDTGELSVPDGIELGKFKINYIMFSFNVMNGDHKKVCDVRISREYSEEGIKVTVTSEEKAGPAVCHDFMDSLESKLKLASKLREAKEKRRRGEQHEKPKEPVPANPDKPK